MKRKTSTSEDVECQVEAEGMLKAPCGQQAREFERQEGGPDVCGGHAEGHTDFAVREGKVFRRVGGGDGTM
jgi:hypothetical protein